MNSDGNYQLEMTTSPYKSDIDYVLQQLRAYNNSKSELLRESRKPEHAPKSLMIYVHDENHKIIGGLIGETKPLLGWLKIEYFWLDESVRGKGVGTKIIQQAEAKRQGCHSAEVSTWSFQAPGFYQKMGYRIVGQLEDHPTGVTDYWLAKKL